MVFYRFYNGKRYYYFNGVLRRFRERVDKDITRDELVSVLKRIDFPIMDVVEARDGMRKVVGYYNVDLIEEWISSRKGSLLDKLREKREYDSGKCLRYFKQKPKLPAYSGRTGEEIEREHEERRKREMERRKAEMERRLREIEDEERRSPEEDMEKVSDELLRQDDVYYEDK